jgi:hypothetical protein
MQSLFLLGFLQEVGFPSLHGKTNLEAHHGARLIHHTRSEGSSLRRGEIMFTIDLCRLKAHHGAMKAYLGAVRSRSGVSH